MNFLRSALALSLLLLPFIGRTQQNVCLSGQTFKIVVLGSSTSAGTGASTPDSAWVNRYTHYLQDINPNNEVVNFGVGGYNTYRIMPTGFVPPAGRPSPDVTKNITAALAESPDAIIINMPSNDVAAGFSYAEQMFNLDTIVSIAQQNNVDIWVCTTQPRNFTNSAQLDLQWEIKDSIYAHFNPFVIDFWTTIATPGYTIEPIYNSGDGVHLNDLGHALLAQRVEESAVLDSIFVFPDSVDFTVSDIASAVSVCGDSTSVIDVIIANIGIEDLTNTTVELTALNTSLGTSEVSTITLSGGLPACTLDTIQFSINTYEAGNYEITATVGNPQDSLPGNDTLAVQFSTSGHPDLFVLNDTLCNPGMATLFALAASGDTTFWYDDPLATTPIYGGSTFDTPFLDSTTYYYAQTVRGNLFYSETLHTSLNSTINFNGTMFDLIANDSIVVDSFDVKINSTGNQNVEVFYKSGTHLGFENDPLSWSLLGTANVNVVDPNAWTSVPLGNLSISQNDTVALYVRMQNTGATLSYSSVSAPQTHSTPALTMITGSGIAANFGTNYYPRDWSGGIYYHHGERPLGDCASTKMEAVAFVNESTLDAGNDTIIDILDTLVLSATGGMTSYDWSTGSDSSSAIFIASDYGMGIHYVEVSGTDSLGCTYSDQVIVGVADLVGLAETDTDISIAPNPAKDLVKVKAPSNAAIWFTTLSGQQIHVNETAEGIYNVSSLTPGVYIVHVKTGAQVTQFKLLKVQ